MRRDEVARWVRTRPVPPLSKLVLMLLFDRAGEQEDGRWACWPSLGELASDAGISSAATVRKHLAALEAEGIIDREARFTRRGGQTTSRIVLCAPRADGSGAPAPGDDGPHSDERPPPLPGERPTPLKPQGSPSEATAREAREQAREQVPDDFPDELRPHARAVYRVLRSVAEAHAARAVTPQALGHLMAAPQRRHKPFIRAAHDFAAWAVDPPRPIRDVVASYRTWIDRERDLATVEPLQAPTPGSTTPAGVTPLRQTAAERRRDLQAERMARAAAAREQSPRPALGA
jgi:hypothetical protein